MTSVSETYDGKVAVVTGAGSGIGRALALELATAGAHLALSDVNEAGLAETLEMLPAGTVARGYKLNVADRAAVFAHAADVKRDFGAAHVLINNAGVALFGTIENSSIEEFEWQININLWGVIYGSKAFLPLMREQGEGHIVNISSVFGLVAVPCQGAYHVSKFGVRGFTECLSQELQGSGIFATSVHPGGIRTNIDSGGRICANGGEIERKFLELTPKMLVTPPEDCARTILRGVSRRKRRILVGKGASTMDFLQRLMPQRYGAVLNRYLEA